MESVVDLTTMLAESALSYPGVWQTDLARALAVMFSALVPDVDTFRDEMQAFANDFQTLADNAEQFEAVIGEAKDMMNENPSV